MSNVTSYPRRLGPGRKLKKNHHSVEKIKPEVEVKRISTLTHRTSACIFFSHLNIVLNSDDTMLEINVKPTSVT